MRLAPLALRDRAIPTLGNRLKGRTLATTKAAITPVASDRGRLNATSGAIATIDNIATTGKSCRDRLAACGTLSLLGHLDGGGSDLLIRSWCVYLAAVS